MKNSVMMQSYIIAGSILYYKLQANNYFYIFSTLKFNYQKY